MKGFGYDHVAALDVHVLCHEGLQGLVGGGNDTSLDNPLGHHSMEHFTAAIVTEPQGS